MIPLARIRARVLDDARRQSGPAVARLFHALLALVFLDAWLSLRVQVDELIGHRGLLPLADFLDAARANDLGFFDVPTWHWLAASDRAIHLGIAAGIGLAIAALLGFAPRLALALSTALYLGYAVGCRTFTSFQWDNLLLECGALAALLPRDRPARWIHVLFRLVLFKLYWESGVAKWQSHLHDWQDGSAMTHYYETAPLPTWLAWHAHALPAWWHRFESWATLGFELVLPFFAFATRRPRLFTAAFLTLFQAVNAATANYGFFCYLAAALHVFLLDERDVERARAWIVKRLPIRNSFKSATVANLQPFSQDPVSDGERADPNLLQPRNYSTSATVADSQLLQIGNYFPLRALRVAGAALVCAAFALVSLVDGIDAFAGWDRFATATAPLQRVWAPFRLVNTYHLFGHITTARIEPEVQTFDGAAWTAHDLRHKAGDVRRAPDFVAPHQPRLDFQLWFHGLGFRSGAPEYVINLVDRVCNDPGAVEGLFARPLPAHPQAARIAYWKYSFTTPEERRATGAWWRREPLGATRPVACAAP